ncbi:MAG: hypothetical protein ACYCV7_01630 [Acidimicrobiales bacterium]
MNRTTAVTTDPDTLEQALDAVGQDAEAALRALAGAAKGAKRARTAAALGQVRELRAALDATVQMADLAAGMLSSDPATRLALRRGGVVRFGPLHGRAARRSHGGRCGCLRI